MSPEQASGAAARFEAGRVHLDAPGERFLMTVSPERATDIEVQIHLNVFDEIGRRIAAAGG